MVPEWDVYFESDMNPNFRRTISAFIHSLKTEQQTFADQSFVRLGAQPKLVLTGFALWKIVLETEADTVLMWLDNGLKKWPIFLKVLKK